MTVCFWCGGEYHIEVLEIESKPKIRWELGLTKKAKKDVRARADAFAAKQAKRKAA